MHQLVYLVYLVYLVLGGKNLYDKKTHRGSYERI